MAPVAAAFSYAAAVQEERIGEFSPYVSKEGAIARPTNYRDTFQHIGTSAVATKPGQACRRMHNVYSRPEDVRAYRRDGKFPDGAVLVNEVTQAGSENAHVRTGPTGPRRPRTGSSWSRTQKGDSPATPSGETDGAGLMFKPNDPAKNVATDY